MWILATECKKQIQARALEAPSKLHLYHLDLICFTYILLCWFLLLQASWNHLRDTSFKKIRTDRVRERRREGEKGEKLWIERTRRERVRRHRNQTWEKRKRKGNGFYFVFCILKKNTTCVTRCSEPWTHFCQRNTLRFPGWPTNACWTWTWLVREPGVL